MLGLESAFSAIFYLFTSYFIPVYSFSIKI